MAIEKNIALLRTTLKLKQKEFGEEIGVSANAICNWESGRQRIPEKKIALISAAFNVRREWLETGVGEIFEEPAAPTQTPEEFAKAFGCDDFTAGIFARYCRFSDDDKARFSDLLKALIADPDSVLSPKGDKTGLVVKNSITGVKNFTGNVGNVEIKK